MEWNRFFYGKMKEIVKFKKKLEKTIYGKTRLGKHHTSNPSNPRSW